MQKIAPLAGIGLALFAAAAPAATPAEATLDFDNLEVVYTGGPFVNANVIHQSNNGTEPTCMSPVLECDEFTLTLDFPEGIGEIYPQAIVRMLFTWVDLTGNGVIDFDFFLADVDGNVINNGGTSSSNPESMTIILPNDGPVTYKILGVPFLALGDSYEATISVDLGEPVEVESGGEGRALGLSGGGSAGGLLLATLALLGLRRRR